jgi:serine protease Do
MADIARIAAEAIFGFLVGTWDGAMSCTTYANVADAAVVQQMPSEDSSCGWIGVTVRPMTAAYAGSLGMAEPYGAIFDQPKPGSPAAAAGIERGDVLTTINGSPLIRASDFAGLISAIAPRTQVYFYVWRNGQPKQVTLILGATPCRTSG